MALLFPLLFVPFSLFLFWNARSAIENFEFRRGWSSTGSGLGGGCARVLRGGSFNNDPDNLRCSNRNNNHPDNRNNNVGFRVVCVAASARKVLARNARRMGEMRRGKPSCAASAKKPPKPPAPRPTRGKDAAVAVAGKLRLKVTAAIFRRPGF